MQVNKNWEFAIYLHLSKSKCCTASYMSTLQ